PSASGVGPSRTGRGGSVGALFLGGLASGVVGTAGAAPPWGRCALLIADNAMFEKSTTPAHAQFLGQRGLGNDIGPDGLKLKGTVPPTNFQAWNLEADGGQVCFADGNPAGSFNGTTETLTGQPFDGTKGWSSNGAGT